MSRATERTVRLSVLDRLIDEAPREAADAPGTWEASLAELRVRLMRDVEWILNTRRTIADPPAGCPELTRSVYAFGLPDISSMAESEEVRTELARSVADCVETFEPRLMAVRVIPRATTLAAGRGIHFTIEALLRLDPSPEKVVFDTVVETVSGRVSVSGGADA